MRRIAFIALILVALCQPVKAQAGHLIVAWSDGLSIWLWREGDSAARTLESPSDQPITLSPGLSVDGRYLAFSTSHAISVLDLNGNNRFGLNVSDAQNIGQIEWLDKQSLIFNTLSLRTDEQVMRAENDDNLWGWDVTQPTGAVICPNGQGGQFALSPDRSRIALVTPGRYADNSPGRISVVDRACQNRIDLLTFPVVNTASSQSYYPSIHWLPDGSGLLAAIPDPKLVYDLNNERLTALWRLPLAGKATQIGSVQAAFFGSPRWSADGGTISYIAQAGDPTQNRIELRRAEANGQNSTVVVSGTSGTLSAGDWIPGQRIFTYTNGQAGEVWLSGPNDSAPRRLAPTPIFHLTWIGQTYLFTTTLGGAGELRYARLDDPQSRLIASVQNVESISAASVP